MAELSVRYAVALFDLAQEQGMLDVFVAQSMALRDALQTHRCREMLEHPSIPDREKKAFIQAVFAGKIHDDLLGFLYLTVAKNRENILIPTLNQLIEMGNRCNRKVTAEVTSAHPLSDGQIDALKSILSNKLNKRVEISLTTDPGVIGGLYVRVDGYLLDFTIKLQINDMTNSIKRSWSNDLKTG